MRRIRSLSGCTFKDGSTDVGNYTSLGAWTLGPTSGSAITHTMQSGAATTFDVSSAGTNAAATINLKAKGTGACLIALMKDGASRWEMYRGSSDDLIFYSYSGSGRTAGFCSYTGAWTFGPTSGLTASHTFYASPTSATNGFTPVVSIYNKDTSTSSDNNYCLWLVKGSTTATSSQKFMRFSVNDGATNSGTIASNGADAAAFSSTSDQRLKTNIVDLPNQLANVLALRPVKFDRTDMDATDQTGFIAQEMQAVYPDSVSADMDGYLSIVGWDRTTARLVKAIQDQQEIISSLTARIEALEAANG